MFWGSQRLSWREVVGSQSELEVKEGDACLDPWVDGRWEVVAGGTLC